MEAALRLAAGGTEVAAIACRLRLALAGLAIGFGAVRRACGIAALVVTALAIAILRRGSMTRMAAGTTGMTLTIVALVAALAIGAAVGLDRVTMATLRTLGLLRGGLQALERFGRLDETSG